MRILRINRASDNLTANGVELLDPVTESNDLCWANECARTEKQNTRHLVDSLTYCVGY